MRFLTRSALIIALALLAAIYWQGLHGDFFFDDIPNIVTADAIHIDSLSLDSLGHAMNSGRAGPLGRPIANLSFAINHYFNGLNPLAFKATNLAIHAANAILVFFLALRLFSSSQPQPAAAQLAAATLALFWLFHPIQTLAVLHVVQRMTSLSAFFLIAGLLLHIRGREQRRPWELAAAWMVFWPLSVLSKETGLLLPGFALSWELIVHRQVTMRLDRPARTLTALVMVAFTASLIYALTPAGEWLWAGYKLRNFSLWERLLTEGRVLWFYLSLMLPPSPEVFGLHHDDIALSRDLFSPWTTLPALLGWAVIVAATWLTRKRAPLVALGLSWFLVGHLLESTVFPLEIAHEHRNYVPLIGILLAVGAGLLKLFQKGGAAKTLCLSFTAVTFAYLALITGIRSNQYGSEILRTQIEAQHHRQSSRAQLDAGSALSTLPEAASASAPIFSLALSHFDLAGQIDPTAKMPFLAKIKLLCTARQTIPPLLIDTLAERLHGTPFAPGDRSVLYAVKEMAIRGTLCLTRRDVDRLFSSALSNPSTHPWTQSFIHSWHADYLWLSEHDMAAARLALETALSLNPTSASNRLKWAQLMLLSHEEFAARTLLIELKKERFSPEEKKTLEALLAQIDVAQ